MKTQSVVAWARLRFASDATPCVVNTMCIFYLQLPYKCNDCGMTTCHKKSLHLHMALHQEPLHPCLLCTKEYFRKGEFVRHMSVTHGGARERCDECGKDFKSKEGPKQHRLTHRREFRYVCDICGNGFMYITNFDAHVNRHREDKPYTYKSCSYKTSSNSDLSRHVATRVRPKSTECGTYHKYFKT